MQQRLLEMAKQGPVRLEENLTLTDCMNIVLVEAGMAHGCRFFTDGSNLCAAKPDDVEQFLHNHPKLKEVDVSTAEKLRKVMMELNRNRLH